MVVNEDVEAFLKLKDNLESEKKALKSDVENYKKKYEEECQKFKDQNNYLKEI